MSADFTPEKEDYKILTPFKMQVLTNFPYIEADFDALTNYQLLCKIVEYLNNVIHNENEITEQVNSLYNAYVSLQAYVNDYFDNLDVQDEINNKLDEMVESGELRSLINDEIFSDLNNKVLQNTVNINANTLELDNCVKEGQTNSVGMDMLTQEVKEALTGGSTAVVGVNSVAEANIQNKAISIFKLDDYLQGTKSISYGDPIEVGERYAGFMRNLNGVADVEGETGTTYSHYIVNLTKDKIYAFTGYNMALACGILVVDGSENVIYDSNPDASSETPRAATSLVFKVNQTGLKAYLSIFNTMYDASNYASFFQRYNSPTLRQVEIFTNSFKMIEPKLVRTISGHYASYQHDTDGLPKMATYASATEYLYEMVKGMHYKLSSYNWAEVAGIYILGLDNSIIYQSSDASVGNSYVEVTRDFTATSDGYIMLFERGDYHPTIEIVYDLVESSGSATEQNLGFNKWYALGDSLTEVNFRASSNYVKYIEDELDLTIVNLGHSSAGFMNSNSHDQNFRTEIDEISGYNYNTDIITVMGSINDFQHIATSLGELGDTTTDTIYGCMYTFCNDLFTKYIGARIGIICPPATGTYHTDNEKFQLYNKALKETAQLFAIPVLDLSEKCNLKPWITNFRNTFFAADGTGASGQVDQTHPNSKGHWLMHNCIKEFIKTL